MTSREVSNSSKAQTEPFGCKQNSTHEGGGGNGMMMVVIGLVIAVVVGAVIFMNNKA